MDGSWCFFFTFFFYVFSNWGKKGEKVLWSVCWKIKNEFMDWGLLWESNVGLHCFSHFLAPRDPVISMSVCTILVKKFSVALTKLDLAVISAPILFLLLQNLVSNFGLALFCLCWIFILLMLDHILFNCFV